MAHSPFGDPVQCEKPLPCGFQTVSHRRSPAWPHRDLSLTDKKGAIQKSHLSFTVVADRPETNTRVPDKASQGHLRANTNVPILISQFLFLSFRTAHLVLGIFSPKACSQITFLDRFCVSQPDFKQTLP